MNLTKEKLAQLLVAAEKAHGEYEKTLGRRDSNWAEWYAENIVKQLDETSDKDKTE